MQWKAKKISRNLVVPAKLTKRENRAMIFVKKVLIEAYYDTRTVIF